MVMVVALCVYIRENIPSQIIERKVQNNIEYFFVEFNLRKKKWVLCCSYNPDKNSISNYFDVLRTEFDIHSPNYENFLLLRDLTAEMADPVAV